VRRAAHDSYFFRNWSVPILAPAADAATPARFSPPPPYTTPPPPPSPPLPPMSAAAQQMGAFKSILAATLLAACAML
jgi:hypothetical protein